MVSIYCVSGRVFVNTGDYGENVARVGNAYGGHTIRFGLCRITVKNPR